MLRQLTVVGMIFPALLTQARKLSFGLSRSVENYKKDQIAAKIKVFPFGTSQQLPPFGKFDAKLKYDGA